VYVSQFPIDLDYWRPLQPKINLKREIGIPEDNLVVGIFSRIGPRKGMDRIPAFKDALNDKSVSFLVLGENQTQDPTEVKCMQALKSRPDIFTHSFVSPIREWYAIIDVFLMLSEMEGIPRSLMEAMAMACPCIVQDVGGIHNLNPKFAFAPNTWVEQIHTLKALISNRTFRLESGRINRQKVEAYNRFCQKRISDFMEGLKHA
jgi:glycosyltransferase involved in cell wall biosynthesis